MTFISQPNRIESRRKKWIRIIKATEQYIDMKGTVAIDFHRSADDLEELLKEKQLNEEYFPIGISVGFFTESNDFYLSIYCIKKDKVGRSIPDIESYAKKNGKVPVTRISLPTEESFEAFRRFVKRGNVELFLEVLSEYKFYEDEKKDID